MKRRILFVDDEPLILQTLEMFLLRMQDEWEMEFINGAPAALRRLAEKPFEVVVSDMQMPQMSGADFLSQVEKKSPDTIRIMLTGDADQRTAREAVNRGHIFHFLNKTSLTDELIPVLQAALNQHRLMTAERELLERTLNGGVKILTDILSMLDPSLFNTAQRLREYLRQCLPSLGLKQTWDVDLAAMLLQIGRVTMPGSVLERARSGAKLTSAEVNMLTRIPQIGSDLLSNIPRLEPVAEIVLYQNKNFDGTGFPVDNVSGEKIPAGSRILRVLDDLIEFEMQKVPGPEAFAKMKQAEGRYDPKILAIVAKSFESLSQPETSTASETYRIPFSQLRVDDILKSDLLTKDGLLIAAAETQVSLLLLRKFHNFAQLSGIREPIRVVRS
jgi:response regulator RpfG family c-di-GMP phosphodiesterase